MNYLTIILFILFSITSTTTFSNDKSPSELELVTGLAKPPFILENLSSGLQLDLITEILASQNIDVSYIPMPLGRNITGFQRGNVDGVITIPPNYKYPSMYISEPYIYYQNVAVSLSDSHIQLKNIKDLSSYSIIAFQNAKKFLGEEFANVAAYSIDYRELANQKQQIEMLFSRRVEVIVLDINIFKYFVRDNISKVGGMPFEVHYLFPERGYSVGFKKEAHMKLFNAGLETIKANGTYQMIQDNYLL
ncbi:transporter substrate-binding domain-containing protein [Thalassotalea sp. LPB0316]|uniref:substrate-binding periplasmic protein n=1 Tax=Thalassotalea sp. LPB0316 TaxID=2769490 RepID=UPI001868F55B|nr:transporter substrate-binding domain-containing protein [Thalassotalea sp. LPB0316]QOL24362.1 transporter substrate-binding domain-containing protein [Thalassotalea sp. LPB0316]